MAMVGDRQGKLNAVQKTLDGLAESIACASAMKKEQQDLLGMMAPCGVYWVLTVL